MGWHVKLVYGTLDLLFFRGRLLLNGRTGQHGMAYCISVLWLFFFSSFRVYSFCFVGGFYIYHTVFSFFPFGPIK